MAVALLVSSSGAARAADADPAAQAYQRAVDLYKAGDVPGALASMRESYRLSDRPELLYNIARLEDQTGDCDAALADYRAYLERVPQGQYRDAATQASVELSARCALETPKPAVQLTAVAASPPPSLMAPAAPSAPPPPVDSPDNTRRWLGWSAIGAGALAGIGAVYFTASALDARSRLRSGVERQFAGGPRVDVMRLRDEQHRDQRWAQVLAVTGGALVGGGMLILVLSSRTQPSAPLTAGVSVSPSLVSAQVSSHF